MIESKAKHAFIQPNSRRFHVILLLMTGMTLFYFARTNIAISMVCMINSTFVNSDTSSIDKAPKHCYHIINSSRSGNNPKSFEGTFDWNEDVQNLIVSSNFWGSLLTTTFAGYLADKTSPKKIIIFCTLTLLITTAAFPPLAIYFGYVPVIISRFLFGIGEAFWAPSFNHILSNWIPLTEKGLAVGIYTSGVQISVLLGNPIAAYFCNTSIGWPGTFYFCAFLLLLYIITWMLCVQNRFDKGKWVTRNEYHYLSANMTKKDCTNKSGNRRILWLRIVTSLPLISILVCRIAEMIYIVFCTIFLPLYLRDTLYVNIMENGVYSAIPFIAQVVAKISTGAIVGELQRKNVITSTESVKICQVTSGIGVMVGLMIIPHIGDCTNPLMTVACFSFILFFFGISANGFFTSIYILSPSMIGFVTSLNMLAGILGAGSTPYIISYLKRTSKTGGWNNVLYFLGITWLIASLFFGIFGSGEKQNWVEQNDKSNKDYNNLIKDESSSNVVTL
uniref:MFS domain-containing protein n=1 Tax=Parastrongyloides trichosuri TaxID=131310 RepID=A0A0N5A155_PARTI